MNVPEPSLLDCPTVGAGTAHPPALKHLLKQKQQHATLHPPSKGHILTVKAKMGLWSWVAASAQCTDPPAPASPASVTPQGWWEVTPRQPSPI